MAFHSNGAYSGDERESRSGGEERPDSDINDKPVYLLEHLATFTVNKETGIVYPSDGMRRLLQLEKTTGIWSQKMQLCLDNHWVLIMDYETGNVIERFPASLIQDPTAFTSNSPMEIYNNILVFIVAGGSGSRSEMHIFQSQSISAVHLVEDLKQLRNGKIVTQLRESIPVLPARLSSASNHHRNEYGLHREHANSSSGVGVGNVGAVISSSTGSGGGGGVLNHNETDSELGIINDETSSTSSDKYERDVSVLNHCFDDIEKFIARLQHAAAASRELERRRRNRKSKKKDPGEGLLTLRTRPPHEKEFIDIFAKFKLSLNLLAKLKAHIHDPNAPELVHFLFTPLALIVEASSDTYYESHLPAHVTNPLLTRDAINLLNNCVTSKETELWRSLGDAWIIPRDQWKGHIGSYHPVFFDGWSPDYPVVDDLEQPSTPNLNSKRQHIIDSHFITRNPTSGFSGGGSNGGGNTNNNNNNNQSHQQHHHSNSPLQQVQNKNDYDFDRLNQQQQQQQQQHHHHHHHHHNEGTSNVIPGGAGVNERSGFRDFSARSDISIDSIERNGINLQEKSQQNAAIHSLVGGIQNMGTAINVVSTNTGVGIGGGGGGGVGDNLNSDIELWLEKLQSRGAKIVQVTYPRTANNDKELTVVRGEYLEILDDTRKWWKARNIRGQTAHVPHTIVTSYNFERTDNEIFNNPVYTQNYNKNRLNEPEPAPQQNSAEWIRNKHIVGNNGPGHFNNTNTNDVDECNNYNKYNYEINHIAPPPPPPPPPNENSKLNEITLTNELLLNNDKDNNHINKNNPITHSKSSDTIQKELKYVLTLFREKRRNLDIIKTPEIYIEQNSNPNEVGNWLREKGFSNMVINNLKGLNGNDLFAFKRRHLEEICGPEEGKRLASQITIQRNVSGYKTARSSELQAILARARQKSEQPSEQCSTTDQHNNDH